MKSLFIIYPYCHIKCTDSEVLIFDTLNKNYVYEKNTPLSKIDRDSLQRGFLEEKTAIATLVEKCDNKNLGYHYAYNDTQPFMYKRNLDFVTSLQKEREALGYNLPSYTNMLLKEITILCNNNSNSFSETSCIQLEYPTSNDSVINIDLILKQLSSFPNLERIIIAGELNTSIVGDVLYYASNRDLQITFRLSSIKYNDYYNYLKPHDNVSIELITDSFVDFGKLKNLNDNRVFVKAIIYSIMDIDKFSGIDNVIYMPILSDDKRDEKMLQQMIVTEKDILNSSKNAQECIIADFVNTNVYGHLTINHNGDVECLGKRLGSIYETDISSMLNKWVNKEDCTWYYVRGKKDQCKDCALQCLCPPISIYEEMGAIKCPCSI